MTQSFYVSIRDHVLVWQSFRTMSRIDAHFSKARALCFRRSQSFANRRHRFSQAMVRSTIQRFGSTMNVAASERLTISTLTWRHTRARAA